MEKEQKLIKFREKVGHLIANVNRESSYYDVEALKRSFPELKNARLKPFFYTAEKDLLGLCEKDGKKVWFKYGYIKSERKYQIFASLDELYESLPEKIIDLVMQSGTAIVKTPNRQFIVDDHVNYMEKFEVTLNAPSEFVVDLGFELSTDYKNELLFKLDFSRLDALERENAELKVLYAELSGVIPGGEMYEKAKSEFETASMNQN